MKASDREEFTKKTPSQRLQALIRSGSWLVLAISIFSVTTSLFVFYWHAEEARRVAEINGKMAMYQQLQAARTTEVLRRAEGHLNAALDELNKSDGNKAAALMELNLAKSSIQTLGGGSEGPLNGVQPNSRSSIEPSWNLNFFSAAYAQGPIPNHAVLSSDAKRWVLGLVLGVLAITFVFSITAIFKTTNPEVLSFAFDTVKTLLGFFIGVATTLIGST